jgi:hypothetical protein
MWVEQGREKSLFLQALRWLRGLDMIGGAVQMTITMMTMTMTMTMMMMITMMTMTMMMMMMMMMMMTMMETEADWSNAFRSLIGRKPRLIVRPKKEKKTGAVLD